MATITQSDYWGKGSSKIAEGHTTPGLTLTAEHYEFTLNGVLNHLINTRCNLERMACSIGDQLAVIGLFEPMTFDNSHEQPDTYNAIGRLDYEARQLDVHIEHLRLMADALLRQYPAQNKS